MKRVLACRAVACEQSEQAKDGGGGGSRTPLYINNMLKLLELNFRYLYLQEKARNK